MTQSKLKARFARLGPVRAIPRAASGSPVEAILRPAGKVSGVKSIDAVHALSHYGVKPLIAKRAVEAMIETGEARVSIPNGSRVIVSALAAAGISATRSGGEPVDVRAIRERLHLSQQEFARRYCLNLRSLQNWEQGREPDDNVLALLRVIARYPDLAAKAQEGEW